MASKVASQDLIDICKHVNFARIKYVLNKNNNSKKLIIGVSILFCTVILIIGVTTAYFTQSDSEDIGNIVATDKVTLDYQDNDDYMLGELIPINEDDLENKVKEKIE